MKFLERSAANKNKGFTLVELLIVIGLLAVLFALGAPVMFDFYLGYQLDSEYSLLKSLFQQARNLAMVNHNESDHGVLVDSQNFVIFQGTSYAARDTSQDRVFPRAAPVTVSGPSELIFAALSGQTASTTYVVSDSRKSKDIYVNSEGLVY